MTKDLVTQIIDSDPKTAVRIITAQDPKSAYNLIFEHPDAPAVAQALPFEDAYLIVKAVGELDSVDLLEMFDAEKIQGFLDLDCWDKDRLSSDRMKDWMDILMAFEDDRFLLQIRQMDNALKLSLFKRFVEVIKVEEPDENPYLNTQDVFLTPDQHHALLFSGTEDDKRLLYEILMRIYRLDLELFYWIVEGIYWEMPSDLEEMAYQEKIGRLDAKGFPDYYTALEIFTLVDPKKFVPDNKQVREKSPDEPPQETSMYIDRYEHPDSLLRRGLSSMTTGLDATQMELMTLVNMASVAHQVSFADFMEVGKMAILVDGYVSLALDHMVGNDPRAAAVLLSRKRLVDLFRIGRSLAVRQARLLKVLLAKAASDGASAAATLLEPRHAEFIEGMIRRIPVFVDAQGKESCFSTMDQLRQARETIDALVQVVNVFIDKLGFSHDTLLDLNLLGTNHPDREGILYPQLFCTAFANDALGKEFTPAPLTAEECLALARSLEQEGENPCLPQSARSKFFAWLDHLLDRPHPQAVEYFQTLFAQMAVELDAFAKSKNRDVRYLSYLIAKITY